MTSVKSASLWVAGARYKVSERKDDRRDRAVRGDWLSVIPGIELCVFVYYRQRLGGKIGTPL